MTPKQAREGMEAAARAARPAVDEGSQLAAALVAQRVARAWPRDSGESAAGWTATGPKVVNPVPHTPFVHNGLHETLVPEAFLETEREFATLVETRIDSAAGW